MEDNLYIIKSYGKNNKSLIKFGYSKDLKSRIEFYLYHNPLCEVIGTFHREDALEFERWFHTNNKSLIKREWYSEKYMKDIISSIKNEPLLNNKVSNSKRCHKCNEIKNIDQFYLTSKNKSVNICKKCSHIESYKSIKNNPERHKKKLERCRIYREANREKHKEYMKEYNKHKRNIQ